MKLEKIIIIVFCVVIVMFTATIGITYHTFNNLCNNDKNYTAIKYFESSDQYKLCGNNFSIINDSDDSIEVTKRKIKGNQEVTSETVDSTTDVVSTETVKTKKALPIEASDNIIYQVESSKGDDMESVIKIKKYN